MRQRKRTHDRIDKKPAKSAAVLPTYSVDQFIDDYFANVYAKEKFILIWKDNIELTREIAVNMANQAAAFGVKDETVITELLQRLLTPTNDDQLRPSDIHQSRYKPEQLANQFKERIKPLAQLLKHKEAIHLFRPFFMEMDEENLDRMAVLLRDLLASDFDPEYISDWLTLYQFILNRDSVMVYLEQLETALQDYCAALPPAKRPRQENGEFILPDENQPHNRGKIFSSYLYQWAKENGFKQSAKIIRALKTYEFVSLLTSATFFKDRAVQINEEHGAWSHALQWYCIFEYAKKTGLFVHPPIVLYQKILKNTTPLSNQENLWDHLLDKYYHDDSKCTIPETFTHIMQEKVREQKWPLLAESIVRLQKKMDKKYSHDGKYLLDEVRKKHLKETNPCGVVLRSLSVKKY